MSTGAIIGGVVVMVCLSSSVGAGMLAMSGDDKGSGTGGSGGSTGPSSTGPSSPGPISPPTPRPAGSVNGYHEINNFSLKTLDENCIEDTPINACKTRCDYDPECISFTVPEEGKCCINYETTDISYNDKSKVYVKNPQKYSVENLGDREGGVLSSDTTSNFTTCIDKCSETASCVGISYKKGLCELKKSDGMASAYSQNTKQFLKNTTPVPGPTPVESVSGFTGSCDDLSGASEDVSASSLQQCGGKCRNDESSFKCVGFMWNGSTCKLYDNAWTTGVDICNDGWTAHRFNGIPQSDNFTSSYDDLSGSYSDITADVRECKVACQNKGSACGGFMHKDTKCRMYEDGSSTGVDIQSTGWTAYRK